MVFSDTLIDMPFTEPESVVRVFLETTDNNPLKAAESLVEQISFGHAENSICNIVALRMLLQLYRKEATTKLKDGIQHADDEAEVRFMHGVQWAGQAVGLL